MTLQLPKTLGVETAENAYTVKDIWAGQVLPGTVSSSLHAVVEEAHGSRFLILDPTK